MNTDPNITQLNDREKLPPEWLAALRALPSEHSKPSAETDAAIFAAARATILPLGRRRVTSRIWMALAAACLTIAFTFLASRGPDDSHRDQAATPPDDPYALILREVTSVFPHQVKAIMSDGGELQIALSEEPIEDGAQAVLIEACGNGSCTVVVTYVGQTIEISRQGIIVKAGKDGPVIIHEKEELAPDLQIKSRKI